MILSTLFQLLDTKVPYSYILIPLLGVLMMSLVMVRTSLVVRRRGWTSPVSWAVIIPMILWLILIALDYPGTLGRSDRFPVNSWGSVIRSVSFSVWLGVIIWDNINQGARNKALRLKVADTEKSLETERAEHLKG